MTRSKVKLILTKSPSNIREQHWIFAPLILYFIIRRYLLILFLYKRKHMTQWRWEKHRHRKGEKIKKSNWMPICPPIRSLHYFWPSLICQLPNQSKHSRCILTRSNGLSLGMCLFIHGVCWNMKTAALNWFSVREQTVMEKCCFTRYSWMHPGMEKLKVTEMFTYLLKALIL